MTLQRKLARHVQVFQAEEHAVQAGFTREVQPLADITLPPQTKRVPPLEPPLPPQSTSWEALAQASALVFPAVAPGKGASVDTLPAPAAAFLQRAKPQPMEREREE